MKDRIFIDKRLKIIENRQRVGDTEGDFIVSGKSGKGVLLRVVDRKLRTFFLEVIHVVTIDEVHLAFVRIKKRFPETKTLTIDNDILFQMHTILEKLLQIKIYFWDTQSVWQKGSIENVNKFIRKFIPKGSNLMNYAQEDIALIEEKCDQRFMCLEFLTPEEVLEKYRQRKNNKKTA